MKAGAKGANLRVRNGPEHAATSAGSASGRGHAAALATIAAPWVSGSEPAETASTAERAPRAVGGNGIDLLELLAIRGEPGFPVIAEKYRSPLPAGRLAEFGTLIEAIQNVERGAAARRCGSFCERARIDVSALLP